MGYLGLLYEILKYATGSVIIGVALALLLTFALFYIIRSCYPRSTFSVPSIITGIILVFLLSYEMIIMCGAIGLKWKCDDFEVYINNLIPEEERLFPRELSKLETHQMIDQAKEEFPLIDYYVAYGDFGGYNTTNIAHEMAETLSAFLNQFIWEALFWSLIKTLLAAIIVVWTIHKGKDIKYRYQKNKTQQLSEDDKRPIERKYYTSSKRGHSTHSKGF